ncbi:MAG: YraN family protein [Anaerolineales bacterium]|nr:YraN family protein [Anaerolineales bacterium]MCB9128506.1 YraN family protein [Ardenticatenales bacterium]
MSRTRVARGEAGERWAARALRACGYHLLDQRWRIVGGEIDLIARDGDEYVFVEVKARRGDRFGTPELAVTPRKLTFLARAAEQWLADAIGDAPATWRIDVVAVELDRRDQPTRITILQQFEL